MGWYYYSGDKVVAIKTGEEVEAVRPHTRVFVARAYEGSGNVPYLLKNKVLKGVKPPVPEVLEVKKVEVDQALVVEPAKPVEPVVEEIKPAPKRRRAARRKKVETEQA
tara:strand:- start:2184 stop:2507 length:324 start_codon:yes stop_codon:yes gene_type:complete